MNLHGPENPPQGGFKWPNKDDVRAEGQVTWGIVITHDCEIENDDSRHQRLVGLIRSLASLNDSDKATIVSGRHFGRLYLPAWDEVNFPESYLDLRRITTLRQDALPSDNRVASLTDFGREVLQAGVIRYLTEKYRA